MTNGLLGACFLSIWDSFCRHMRVFLHVLCACDVCAHGCVSVLTLQILTYTVHLIACMSAVCVCGSHQCRRRACRKADSPSMMSRMATVRVAKAEKMIDRAKNPAPLREDRPRCITMVQSTSDNSAHTHTRTQTVKTTRFTPKYMHVKHL